MPTDQTFGSSRHVIDRRSLLIGAGGMAALAAVSDGPALASQPGRKNTLGRAFPHGFLWGASTAAHQVEGGNTASDYWLLEHMKPSLFGEPSGDACDHYHRFHDDIAMLADFGLNTYRFSVEWARIEPEKGFISLAALDHYRRMLARCHELSVVPVVTLHHFSAPRWFAAEGGWESVAAAENTARYVENVARHLGDLIGWAVTINEPNTAEAFPWKGIGNLGAIAAPALAAAAAHVGSQRFSSFPFGDVMKTQSNLLAAHRIALAALKSGPGRYPVGPALAITDDRPNGTDTHGRDRKRAELYEPWFAALQDCDYIGVQTYTGMTVGLDRDLPPAPGKELTQMGYAFCPEALGATIRYTAKNTHLPILVTENGVATLDDRRRVAFIEEALDGVLDCLADGIDVRGYLHWSLLDNFEWDRGYTPKFGLVEVDRTTFERHPRPSARRLGEIARANRLVQSR